MRLAKIEGMVVEARVLVPRACQLPWSRRGAASRDFRRHLSTRKRWSISLIASRRTGRPALHAGVCLRHLVTSQWVLIQGARNSIRLGRPPRLPRIIAYLRFL